MAGEETVLVEINFGLKLSWTGGGCGVYAADGTSNSSSNQPTSLTVEEKDRKKGDRFLYKGNQLRLLVMGLIGAVKIK